MKLGLIAGNGRFPFLLLLCCSFGLLEASGQEVVPVNANIIMGHLLHHVPPVYPRDASAAHVEGSVIIDARIGTSGTIESTNVVSGP